MSDKEDEESWCYICIGLIIILVALVFLIKLYEWNSVAGIVALIVILGVFLKIAWDVGWLDFIRWSTSENLNRYVFVQKKIDEFNEAGVIVDELKGKLSIAKQNQKVNLLSEILEELNQIESRWKEYEELLHEYACLREQNQEIIDRYFKHETAEIDKLFEKAILRLDNSQLLTELSKFKTELYKIIKNKKGGYY